MKPLKLVLLYALSALPVAFIGFFVREAVVTANIFTVSFYRLLIAAITLAIILPFLDKNTFRPSRKHLPMYAVIGFLIAFNFTIFNLANNLTPIANVYLLASISPAIVLFLSAVYLRERITSVKILVLILTLAGIAVMNPLSSGNLLGNGLALLAGATFGIMFTLMKFEDVGVGAGVTFWYFAFATVFSSPLLLFGHAGIVPAIPWVLGLGIISTGFVFVATTLLLESEPAGVVSIIQTIIIPITAIILALFAFGEVPTVRMLLGGGLLITAGVLLEIPSLFKSEVVRLKKVLGRR